jgi:hypothetical protein
MRLSALLLTLVIALGTTAPLAAKAKNTAQQHARTVAKARKVSRKPAKPAKVRQAKRPRSV